MKLTIVCIQRAPEDITRDIQRKQRELCDGIAEGKRSLKAATDWRTQQKLFDAIAEARRKLRAATDWCDEDPQEHFRRLKPLEICLCVHALVPNIHRLFLLLFLFDDTS